MSVSPTAKSFWHFGFKLPGEDLFLAILYAGLILHANLRMKPKVTAPFSVNNQ